VNSLNVALKIENCQLEMAYNVWGLAAGGEIEIRLPVLSAKFIIKSSLFILSLNSGFSARDYCRKMHHSVLLALQPGLHKCECWAHTLSSFRA
jgi:hypothetical protein